MMYFNFSKLFKLRGISKGTKFLEKHGLSYNQAYRMLYYRSSETHLRSLEKVCLALNCTPNDLIEWKPGSPEDDIAGHALQKIRGKESFDLNSMLNDVPLDRIDEVRQAMVEAVEKIKNSENK